MSKHRTSAKRDPEEETKEPEEPGPAFPKAVLPLAIGAAIGLLSYGIRSAGASIGLLMLAFFLLRPLAIQFGVKFQGAREWAGALWFIFTMWFVTWAGLLAMFG